MQLNYIVLKQKQQEMYPKKLIFVHHLHMQFQDFVYLDFLFIVTILQQFWFKIKYHLTGDIWNVIQLSKLVCFYAGLGLRVSPTSLDYCVVSDESCNQVAK